MATMTNAFVSSGAVGIREALADFVDIIAVEEAPLVSKLDRYEATNSSVDWQRDSLANTSVTTRSEGDDFAPASLTATTRLNNVMGIVQADGRVSGSMIAFSHAGVENELAYQADKKARELVRNMEAVMLANRAKSSGDPRIPAGLPTFLSENVNASGSTLATATGANAVDTTSQSNRDVTEQQLLDVLQQMDARNDANRKLMVLGNGKTLQNLTYGLTAGSTRQIITGNTNTISGTITAYDTPYGLLNFQKDNLVQNIGAGTAVYILDQAKLKIAYAPGRWMQYEEMPTNGDAKSFAMRSEFTLVVVNPAANGIVRDLNV